MTDLKLGDVLVLALALEIIETGASVSELVEVLERHRFITTKNFNAYDLHCMRREHLNLEYGLFNERQLRAIQIKNVLGYLEENTVYVPKHWGNAQEDIEPLFDNFHNLKPATSGEISDREVGYEEAKWYCEKYRAKAQD